MKPWDAPMEWLGRGVIVTLGEEDGAPVIATGKLLRFSNMGEVVLEDEMGDVHYCWPMLDIIPSLESEEPAFPDE